jgi:filamentous hemagglutinin
MVGASSIPGAVQYANLSLMSVGSPLSDSVMKNAVTKAGGNYLGQVNDWRDPVTNSKTWIAGTGTLAVGGAVAGVLLAPATGGGSLYAYGTALIGGGIGGGGLIYGINNYHAMDQYLTKPKAKSIMFDWLQKNGKP